MTELPLHEVPVDRGILGFHLFPEAPAPVHYYANLPLRWEPIQDRRRHLLAIAFACGVHFVKLDILEREIHYQ